MNGFWGLIISFYCMTNSANKLSTQRNSIIKVLIIFSQNSLQNLWNSSISQLQNSSIPTVSAVPWYHFCWCCIYTLLCISTMTITDDLSRLFSWNSPIGQAVCRSLDTSHFIYAVRLSIVVFHLITYFINPSHSNLLIHSLIYSITYCISLLQAMSAIHLWKERREK